MSRVRLAVLITLSLAAIAVPLTAASGASSGQAKGKTITIGISLSLSGDFSDSGKAAMRGYQLWRDVVNAHGGLLGNQVKLKILDDTSSPTQVVTNYQNLITRDKVDLVFGPFSSLLTGPAATVANRYGYAFLEPAGGGPKVFALKLPNLFFLQPAPVVRCGDPFVDWLLTLPRAGSWDRNLIAAERVANQLEPHASDPLGLQVLGMIALTASLAAASVTAAVVRDREVRCAGQGTA